ncbi:MAG: hypothetical protein Barrevirus3_27 [Barrevirus sp.]|uniref:Uncharacterized protein n=1 Tax=Barrevirus sp. TaxID=2487763 RepID=A0A3G4ZPV3_9VIRU|nr:MAG: hypothetical protein Barrevirus3_27 [Barrevirus sp.]
MKPGVGQQNSITIISQNEGIIIVDPFCWPTPGFIIRTIIIQLYETGGRLTK